MARLFLSRRRLLLFACGALALAVNLSHWVLPEDSVLTAMNWPVRWIESTDGSARGVYRYTVDIPFTPQWAWVSIATEDYLLYINGNRAAENTYLHDTTLTLQHRAADKPQSINPFAPSVVHKAELRRAANDEWRFPQHLQIASYLHPGRNVFALFQQSQTHSRFAIRGRIEGNGQSIDISSDAKDWKFSPISKDIDSAPWYSPQVEPIDWPTAKAGPWVDQVFYAAAPPAIWETRMPREGLTGPTSGGDLRFTLDIPERRIAKPETSWVRVYSNWQYNLFVDDQWVGTGGGLGAEAWDLASFRKPVAQRLNLRLVRQTDTRVAPPLRAPVPVVVVDGRIGDEPISSRSGWRWVADAGIDWLSGTAPSSLAALIGQDTPPRRVTFQFRPELGASWYGAFALLWLASLAFLIAAFQALRLVERLLGKEAGTASGAATWVLSLLTVGLIFIELLRFRLMVTDSFLMFISPENYIFIQILCLLLLILAVAAYYTLPRGAAAAWRAELRRNWPTICLFAILALALVLRLYHIGFEDLQDDENVSWDAARGIMRTGLPVQTSGIFYTRSALYHVLLAGWLTLFGDTKTVARMLGVIPGVVAVWLTYRVTLHASGGRKIPALMAALILAVDPWELRNSQGIRFYQQVQAFSLMAMYMFLLGFVDHRGKLYQNLFFLAAGAAVLSQEVFVLTFPGFCIAGLYFYRPWHWRENLNVCVGFVVVLAVVLYDVAMFQIVTLTANVGVSSSNLPAIMLHLWNITILGASFFIGYLQNRLVFTAAFIVGLIYWSFRPNRYIATLYIQLVSGIVAATILVVQIEHRYVYLFYPFLVVIAAVTVDAMLREAATAVSTYAGTASERLRRRWLAVAGTFCSVALLFSMEPDKMLMSFDKPINTQQESAFWFIVDHRRPGDVVLSNTPGVAASVTHGLDYFLTNLLFFDALYQPENEIVDRWAGADIVTNSDMIRKVLLDHDRIWIVLLDDKFNAYPPNWQKLLSSAEVKYEWFGGRVLLWEHDRGALQWAPDSGAADNAY